jgi:hypothetical protein
MCINSLFAPFVVKRGNPPFRGRVGKAILDLRICSSCVGVVHATKADAEVDKEHSTETTEYHPRIASSSV